MTALRSWWRLRAIGNRWARRRDVASAVRTAALLIALLVLYGIAGRMDYEDALIAESSAQAARAERMSATLADCLNGRAVWTTPDKRLAVVCRPAEEFPL